MTGVIERAQPHTTFVRHRCQYSAYRGSIGSVDGWGRRRSEPQRDGRGYERRRLKPTPAIPRAPSSSDEGSGTVLLDGVEAKFRSPVLVPAVVRVSATPIVSEYGSVVGTSELVVVPAYAGAANDPVLLNRFAPLNCNAVLDVPPQARPVTVPLSPELVPPIASN